MQKDLWGLKKYIFLSIFLWIKEKLMDCKTWLVATFTKYFAVPSKRVTVKPVPHLSTFSQNTVANTVVNTVFGNLLPHLKTLFATKFYLKVKQIQRHFRKSCCQLAWKKMFGTFFVLEFEPAQTNVQNIFCVPNTKILLGTVFATVFCENVLRCGSPLADK